MPDSLIKISNYKWVRGSCISSCEIYQKEDNCWYVRWATADGEMNSDAFTGRISAQNYIKEISDLIWADEKEAEIE